MILDSAEKICRIPEPLNWTPEKVACMVAASRDMALFHQANSLEIRHLFEKAGFDPNSVQQEEDLLRIPQLGVTAMKSYLLLSKEEKTAVLKLTSSGTRGQKTQIWFDQESLDRAQGMLDVLWAQEGLVSNEPTHYINFIYDPEEAKDLGIAFSVNNEQRFAPAKESVFVVKKNDKGAWEFRIDLALERLRHYASLSTPVRILGIPSFMYDLLVKMEQDGERITLPKGSCVLTGGGWKAAEDKSITREKFRAMLVDRLGFNPDLIRDGYGLAEHAAPYIECKEHRFHIPVYNRVIPRNPETLEALPPGQIGLLEFLSPLNTMMPTLAILSTDLGYLDKDKCKCGWNSPTFTLVGRGGLTKHKGCAITAGEIVRRGA